MDGQSSGVARDLGKFNAKSQESTAFVNIGGIFLENSTISTPGLLLNIWLEKWLP